MLQLAGEIADGVLINTAKSSDIVDAIGLVKTGLENAGRPKEAIDLVAYVPFSVDEDIARASKAARYVVSKIVGGASVALLKRLGIKLEDVVAVRESIIRGDSAGAMRSVTDEMLEAFAVVGRPENCIEKLFIILETGVTQLALGSPLGRSKSQALRIVEEKILPRLGTESLRTSALAKNQSITQIYGDELLYAGFQEEEKS